jgi:hypothetical protein
MAIPTESYANMMQNQLCVWESYTYYYGAAK